LPPPRFPPQPATFPFPFFPTRAGQLRQLTTHDQLGSLPSLSPSRDGRGHQWQAPPRDPSASPRLSLSPSEFLYKLELELLLTPLHSKHTTTRT
jgi:hypothetical protein